MKKKLSFILLVLFIATLLSPLRVNASTVSNELRTNSELTQWVLDEPTNTLYAISKTSKNLIFINSVTMNIEKTLTFNGTPTDIIKDNGKLYIALDDTHQIAIVDMASKSITETLYTSSDPYSIVKDGNKIYYAERDQWCYIYQYNLTAKTDEKLSVDPVYQPDLAININDHILYIGESGSSGCDMTYYSTINNNIIGKTNYNNGYGFPVSGRYTLFDGTNVYFAGRDFKPNDPTRFNGDFGVAENVIYVNKGLVYTNKGIYNKDSHVKLGDYGLNANLVQASDNTLYIYSKDNGVIKRFTDTSNVIDSSNVISLISGNAVSPIQNTEQSTQTSPSISKLEMKSKLIKWVLNEPTNTLYGISKDDKTLFFINAETLNLEKSLTFPSSPTDIIQDGGNLYIALDDANEIVIVDINKRAITGTLYTSSDPYSIEKDGDKIYYAERDQFCDIYQYDLTTKTDAKTSVNSVNEPDLAINTEDHILYIGESGSSGCNMTYYSTTENKVTGKTNYNNGYGFYYPGRYTLFDGEKVYYAGFAFDRHIPTRILGSFDNEDIIFAKYGTVFTKTGLYDSDTYTLLTNFSSDLIETSDNYIDFYYRQDYNSIYRVDPTKMSQVLFDSQGGSDMDYIIADKDTLIQAPDSPTRPGYTFEGWYKEAECINKWDFATEKVASNNMTLYAKWSAAANGWCYSQGKWYFFKNSSMVTNGWTQDSAKHWYYMGADGAMVTNTWVQDSLKRWYYMGADGALVTNTWKQDASKSWYYLGSDGSMAANKWILDNGKWYYLKANGAMATGWLSYGGGWYYLYSSGEMAKNTTIDGYKLNASGMWVK